MQQVQSKHTRDSMTRGPPPSSQHAWPPCSGRRHHCAGPPSPHAVGGPGRLAPSLHRPAVRPPLPPRAVLAPSLCRLPPSPRLASRRPCVVPVPGLTPSPRHPRAWPPPQHHAGQPPLPPRLVPRRAAAAADAH
jgi:hypothetical protein